jgi:Na+-translocating ferredoxin:NAD+ oxidoreductase RnfC subunit
MLMQDNTLSQQTIRDMVREAGVVGAGGAGFPAHVKLQARADTVIANGAECEPLLYVDQTLMQQFPQRVVEGLRIAMRAVGAKRGVIATKKHYHEAVERIRAAIQNHPEMSLYLMDSYYPAGDEKSLVYEVTGEVVRSAKLPNDYGCVVSNIGTLYHIADASQGKPVTDKMVTVCGDVPSAATVCAPVGTSIREMILAAGFDGDEGAYRVLEGGPLMGHIRENWDSPITKTTGGLVVLKDDHPLIVHTQMPVSRQVKLAMAVCCQCNMCTIMCPRNTLGLHVEPHKAMRAIANGDGALVGNVNSVLACCSCNLCSHYACNFGLTPGTVMTNLKGELLKSGVKPRTEEEVRPDPSMDTKRIPISRLIARMGLQAYHRPAPYQSRALVPGEVRISLKQHIGVPSIPQVREGQRVQKGEMIGRIPEGSLGANVHASIMGTVISCSAEHVVIRAQGA